MVCVITMVGCCCAAVPAAAFSLPDGRAWEMVSPPNKHGAALEALTEEGGLIQSAAAGGAFAYVALGPITGEPFGVRVPEVSQLLAARQADGWHTVDITTPHEEVTSVQVGAPSEYGFFTEDLSRSIVEPKGATPLSPQATERTPYEREANGEFVPLVTAGNVPPGTEFAAGQGVEFRTATPDLSAVILSSPNLLTGGFGPGFEPAGQPNLYEQASGTRRLISLLPNDEPTAEAELTAGVGRSGHNMRGAISNDGNRVIFETSEALGSHLYLRDVALKKTLQLDEVQAGGAGGEDVPVFQAASSDGSKVFFTDVSRLTADATAAPREPDLYMCEVVVTAGVPSCHLSDLSADPNPGEAAAVQGVVAAIDAQGGHVYFAANGVLTTTPNARGEHAAPGVCNSSGEATCNLYEYDTISHSIRLVAVLSSMDDPDWAGRTNLHFLGNLTARSSPDGRFFTFMSRRSLTGYDNHDAQSGQLDEEVYLFDADSGALRCLSCNPTGARPAGVFDKDVFPGLLVDHPQSWIGRWLAGSIPGWTLQSLETSRHQSRYLSDSGRTFFNSPDALVPEDTNGVEDVYEYEPAGVGDCSNASATYSTASGGCVALISSGQSNEESTFLDASESGDEAFFLTTARLVKHDVDSAFDVYDAHVCSASSPCSVPPEPPIVCEGEGCQTVPGAPNDPTPGSLSYKGPGNVLGSGGPPPPGKPPSKSELLAKALKSCRQKKAKKKRVACERAARRKYGAKKPAGKKHAKGKKSAAARRRP